MKIEKKSKKKKIFSNARNYLNLLILVICCFEYLRCTYSSRVCREYQRPPGKVLYLVYSLTGVIFIYLSLLVIRCFEYLRCTYSSRVSREYQRPPGKVLYLVYSLTLTITPELLRIITNCYH